VEQDITFLWKTVWKSHQRKKQRQDLNVDEVGDFLHLSIMYLQIPILVL